MRRQAAHLTLAIAEFFRDQGLQRALHDRGSITRLPRWPSAEIGLAAGEPPADQRLHSDGIHRIAEIAGARRPGRPGGRDHRHFPTVLVDGDDQKRTRWPTPCAAFSTAIS
jgi:flagellum-specific ATP synthase